MKSQWQVTVAKVPGTAHAPRIGDRGASGSEYARGARETGAADGLERTASAVCDRQLGPYLFQ